MRSTSTGATERSSSATRIQRAYDVHSVYTSDSPPFRAGDIAVWWGRPVGLLKKLCTLAGNEYWDCACLYLPEPEVRTLAFRV